MIGYADCGSRGAIDELCERLGAERLPGETCYDLFAGTAAIAAIRDEEPGTFFLTDFLVKTFDHLVWRGLGLDRHPDLRDTLLRQLPSRRLAGAGADAASPAAASRGAAKPASRRCARPATRPSRRLSPSSTRPR